jgi:nucleotide-binding universal stress UspA family protein
MRAVKRILVPTDNSSCAQAALDHATHIGRHVGAEVHILQIAEPRVSYADGFCGVDGKETRDENPIRPSVMVTESDLVPYRRVTRTASDVSAAILEYVQQADVDLIVMGAHGERAANRFLTSGLEHLLIGQTAEQIVQRAPCPVFTVGMRRGRFPSLVDRILVPVDFSPFSQRAVTHARQLAALYDAKLDVLHVIELQLADDEPDSAVASVERGALQRLEHFYAHVPGPDVPFGAHVVWGRPTRQIVQFAEQKEVQLIVLGSHGHATAERLPLGRESEQIVQMVSFSLFTVRTGAPAQDTVTAEGTHRQYAVGGV